MNRPNSGKRMSKVRQLAIGASEFSMYGNDVDRLDAQVSVSGPDMIRLTIRDAEKSRYEVPVPIQWQPSVPSSAGLV